MSLPVRTHDFNTAQTPERLSMKSSSGDVPHQSGTEWDASMGLLRTPEEKQTVDVRTPYLNDSAATQPYPTPPPRRPCPVLPPTSYSAAVTLLSGRSSAPHVPPGRHNNLVFSRPSADSFCFLFIFSFSCLLSTRLIFSLSVSFTLRFELDE